VFDLRRRKIPSSGPDRLVDQLNKVERPLEQWISRSSKNAERFRSDPLGAMRAAGLDIEDDIMLELELTIRAISKKLK
jgi:hypothetical protein